MAFAIFKSILRRELRSRRDDEKNSDLTELIAQSDKDLKLLSNATLDIAITGMAGTGKSSLVNALRGIPDKDEKAAKVGVTETTMKQKPYPHPTFPKVTVWDLPGIGTPKFNANQYLKKVDFQQYDFFIIVSSDRFTENDVHLADAIQKTNKKFYYVRTKVDKSIEAEKRSADLSEEECLENIRKYCCDHLTMAGESNPRVFLISNWDSDNYDFPSLQDTLLNDLDDLKRHALILAMPAFSEEALQKKKAEMESHIWKIALGSCATEAVPVPGFSLFCDTCILGITMMCFYKVFGLDEDSLHRLAKRVGQPVDVLRSAIKRSPMVHENLIEMVLNQLSKTALQQKLKPEKLALEYKSALGCLAGGFLSYVTTFYTLKNFLDDVEEDARNVVAKAKGHCSDVEEDAKNVVAKAKECCSDVEEAAKNDPFHMYT